ncbi:MAG: hypothetical protein JXL20_08120 [Deltaproteobacteria bacterium]|nr:hypothetical protein [Deltaproteobacteria bacterium]
MDRTLRIAGWMKRSGLLLTASIIVLAGCQAALLTYKGEKVRSDSLIALVEGTQGSSVYQTADVIIDYRWARKGSALQLSGVVKFTSRMQNNFSMIPVFDLSLFFTDAEGIILEQRYIAVPGNGEPNSPMRISVKLLLPPGTVNMAFSYSGEARDSGADDDKGGGDMPFWQAPIVR